MSVALMTRIESTGANLSTRLWNAGERVLTHACTKRVEEHLCVLGALAGREYSQDASTHLEVVCKARRVAVADQPLHSRNMRTLWRTSEPHAGRAR